jgi:hypothetical protein
MYQKHNAWYPDHNMYQKHNAWYPDHNTQFTKPTQSVQPNGEPVQPNAEPAHSRRISRPQDAPRRPLASTDALQQNQKLNIFHNRQITIFFTLLKRYVAAINFSQEYSVSHDKMFLAINI